MTLEPAPGTVGTRFTSCLEIRGDTKPKAKDMRRCGCFRSLGLREQTQQTTAPARKRKYMPAISKSVTSSPGRFCRYMHVEESEPDVHVLKRQRRHNMGSPKQVMEINAKCGKNKSGMLLLLYFYVYCPQHSLRAAIVDV